jgi:hypothetical protein
MRIDEVRNGIMTAATTRSCTGTSNVLVRLCIVVETLSRCELSMTSEGNE